MNKVFKTTNEIVISLEEALNSLRRREWIDAINKELLSQRINNTWVINILPEGIKPLQTRFVLRPKFDENGKEVKLKARLVIKGYLQQYGINYEDTYAPVTKLTSLRMFFAIANQFNMHMIQLDVVTASIS